MRVIQDFAGRSVRLTEERLAHILKHPEMEGQIDRITETLNVPDGIIQSRHDATVHIYYRLYEESPVTRKFLLVAVALLEDDAFIITSFFASREPKGETVWPK